MLFKKLYAYILSSISLSTEAYIQSTQILANGMFDILIAYFKLEPSLKEKITLNIKTDRAPGDQRGSIFGSSGYSKIFDKHTIIVYPHDSVVKFSFAKQYKAQLEAIADTLLHEFCHVYQKEAGTYPQTDAIMYSTYAKFNGDIPFEVYTNFPWEIEARDFVTCFKKTVEYTKIQEQINHILDALVNTNMQDVTFGKSAPVLEVVQ